MESSIAEFLMRWLACLRATANVVGSTLSDLNAQGHPDVFFDLLPNCLHGWASCLRYERTVYDRVHNWHWASALLLITAFTS